MVPDLLCDSDLSRSLRMSQAAQPSDDPTELCLHVFDSLTTSLRRAAIAAIYFSAKTTESDYSSKTSMKNLREAAIAATAYNPCIC